MAAMVVIVQMIVAGVNRTLVAVATRFRASAGLPPSTCLW